MPIYLHPANLIIQKSTIIQKYNGGIEGFRKDFISSNNPYNQEDNELFSLSKLNAYEFDISDLVLKGLTYESKNNSSEDFVVQTRLDGFLWKANWIRDNRVFAWHINSKVIELEQVHKISDLTPEQIDDFTEREAYYPLRTIRL